MTLGSLPQKGNYFLSARVLLTVNGLYADPRRAALHAGLEQQDSPASCNLPKYWRIGTKAARRSARHTGRAWPCQTADWPHPAGRPRRRAKFENFGNRWFTLPHIPLLANSDALKFVLPDLRSLNVLRNYYFQSNSNNYFFPIVVSTPSLSPCTTRNLTFAIVCV